MRTMAKVTAILSIVFGALGVITGVVLMGVSGTASTYYTSVGSYYSGYYTTSYQDTTILAVFIVVGAIIMGLSIAQICVAARALSANARGLGVRGYMIALLVLSLIGNGGIIVAVCAIVTLCTEGHDAHATAAPAPVYAAPVVHAPIARAPVPPVRTVHGNDFDSTVMQLKQLKELLDAGILTQQEFDTKKKQILGY